ncbi:hypothetical protein QCM77_15565 [Bradyrhizobium sp. SSUT18]|nr:MULTISPECIES: hypothetical protein [unclassified Bradyrhizobium]MDH2341481.1 hypothetical protein [Bradyrhizobium sp. SSUT77]MDH2354880.1 hypothetical protein [Bradyrhizobium sp. SSUT112]MDH2401359.1 hypothetical protein [Bradyrhizobium sp. SSUT18]
MDVLQIPIAAMPLLLGGEPHRAVMACCVDMLIAAVALRERLRAG